MIDYEQQMFAMQYSLELSIQQKCRVPRETAAKWAAKFADIWVRRYGPAKLRMWYLGQLFAEQISTN